jgi:hypothetical protein
MSSRPPNPLSATTTLPVTIGRSAPLRSHRSPLVLAGPVYSPLVWWLQPFRAIAFIVLPIFCFAAYLNQYNYGAFGSVRDFVTRETFALAIFSAAMLLLGTAIGMLSIRRNDEVTIIDEDRVTRVLVWLGWITIAAYVLLLGTLIVRYDLVLALLRGNPAAPSELRLVLGRIPGVTSFIQFGFVYLALLSALVTMSGFRISPRMRTMALTIIVLTFLRSLFASERLALLEILAAIFLIPVAYRWRPSALRTLAPFLGIGAVFIAFAAGEYLRSWQYYRNLYASYYDFITQRFAGYFSTSINNGSGAYLLFGKSHPVPQITTGWISKFPGLGRLFATPSETMLDHYLATYGSPEFNNPGGFYAAYLDYNFTVASGFMIVVGVLIGLVYRSFENKSLIGLILYPAVFLGMTDLIRIMYLTDTRTLPIFLGSVAVVYAVRPKRLSRERFLMITAGDARL